MIGFFKRFICAALSVGLVFLVSGEPVVHAVELKRTTTTSSASTVAAQAASLSKTVLTLYTGETSKLTVNNGKGAVKWISSNKTVATVSNNGEITAKKAGNVKITATVGKTKLTCQVKVKPPALSAKKLTLTLGKTDKLKLRGAGIKSVTTSNSKVATISKTGVVTAKGCGTATLKVKGKNGKTYTCKVTVNAKLSADKLSLAVGESKTLTLKGAKLKKVYTSNETVAKVDKNGKVTALSGGTATVTLVDSRNTSHKCKVTVRGVSAAETGLTVKKVTLSKGATKKLVMKGGYGSITWSSSNAKVATVDKNGNVKAVGTGSATISALMNGKTYKCKVTVKAVTISATSLTLKSGANATLTLNGASIKSVQSANTAVADVATTGVVTGLTCGETTVTITDTYGNKFTVKVTVVSALKEETLTIKLNNSATVELLGGAAVVAATSKNPSTATVDETGKVTGVKCGTTTVSVTDSTGAEHKVTIIVCGYLAQEAITLVGDQTGTVELIGTSIKSADRSVPDMVGVSFSGSTATITPNRAGECVVTVTDTQGIAHTCKVTITGFVKGKEISVKLIAPKVEDDVAVVMPSTEGITTNTQVKDLDAPSCAGKTFTGWTYDKAGEKPVSADTYFTDGMVLYAQLETLGEAELPTDTFLTYQDAEQNAVITLQAASESAIRQNITFVNADTEEAVEYRVSKAGDFFTVAGEEEYELGGLYRLTITGPEKVRLVDNGTVKGEECITCNLYIKEPKQELNMSFNENMKYLQRDELKKVSGTLQAGLMTMAEDGTQSDSSNNGEFQYRGKVELLEGDTVAVYEGKRPDERTLEDDQNGTGGEVTWLKIVTVGDTDEFGWTTYEYESATFMDIVAVPDNLPLSTQLDLDGDKTNHSMTVETSMLNFDSDAYAAYGISAGTTLDENDFLCLYDGEPEKFSEKDTYTFVRVTSVTTDGANTIITYRDADPDEVNDSLNVYEETDVDVLGDMDEAEIHALEADMAKQMRESDFLDESKYYLAQTALESEELEDWNDYFTADAQYELVLEDGTPATPEDVAKGEQTIYIAEVTPEEDSNIETSDDKGGSKGDKKESLFEVETEWKVAPIVTVTDQLKHYKKKTGVRATYKMVGEVTIKNKANNAELHVDVTIVIVNEALYTAKGKAKFEGGWKFWEWDWKVSATIDTGFYTRVAVEAKTYIDLESGDTIGGGTTASKFGWTSAMSQEADNSIKELYNNVQKVKDAAKKAQQAEEKYEAFLEVSKEENEEGLKSLPERYSEMMKDEDVDWVTMLSKTIDSPTVWLVAGTIGIKATVTFSLDVKLNVVIGMVIEGEYVRRITLTGRVLKGTLTKTDSDTEKYVNMQFYAMGLIGIRPGMSVGLAMVLFMGVAEGSVNAGIYLPIVLCGYVMAEYGEDTNYNWECFGAYYLSIDIDVEVWFNISGFWGTFSKDFPAYSTTIPIAAWGSASVVTGFASGEDRMKTNRKTGAEEVIPNERELSLQVEDAKNGKSPLTLANAVFDMYTLDMKTGDYYSGEANEDGEVLEPLNYMYDCDPFEYQSGLKKSRSINTDTYFKYQFTGNDAEAFSYDPTTKTVTVNNDISDVALSADLTFTYKGKWAPATSVMASNAPKLTIHLTWENSADLELLKVDSDGGMQDALKYFPVGSRITVRQVVDRSYAPSLESAVKRYSSPTFDGAVLTLPESVKRVGYSFGGWVLPTGVAWTEETTNEVANGKTYQVTYNVAKVTLDEAKTIGVTWTPRDDTKYTVNVYRETLSDSKATGEYELFDCFEDKGTTDSVLEVTYSSYNEGSEYLFELNRKKSDVTKTIAPDGRGEFNLYYSVKPLTLTFETGDNAEVVGVPYETTVSGGVTGIRKVVPKDRNTEWAHSGWELAYYQDDKGVSLSEAGGTVTLDDGTEIDTISYDEYRVTKDTTLTAHWIVATRATYKVEYYVYDDTTGEYFIDTSLTQFKEGSTKESFGYESMRFSKYRNSKIMTVLPKVEVKRGVDNGKEDSFCISPYGTTAVSVYMKALTTLTCISNKEDFAPVVIGLEVGESLLEGIKAKIPARKTETSHVYIAGVYADKAMTQRVTADKTLADFTTLTFYLKWENAESHLDEQYYVMNDNGEYDLVERIDRRVTAGVLQNDYDGTGNYLGLYEYGAGYVSKLGEGLTYSHAVYADRWLTEADELVKFPDEESTAAICYYYDRASYTTEWYESEESEPITIEARLNKQLTKLAPNFTKDGCLLVGWKNSAGEWMTDTSVVTGDSKWYAQWDIVARTYQTEYYTETLTKGEYELYKTESADCVVGDTVSAQLIEIEGFAFETHDNNVLSALVTKDESPVLRVYYSRNHYSVAWTVNDALHQVDDVAYGATVSAPAEPELVGYTFLGWSDEGLIGVAMPARNVTIGAKLSPNVYSVTYDANSGTVTAAGVDSVTYGTAWGALATPEREGYTFIGWFTAPDGGSKVENTTLFDQTEAQTLYAQWSSNPAEYTVCHWLQDTYGEGFTEVEDERATCTGETDAMTAVLPSVYQHYTALPVEQKVIAANGSTVVNIYYVLDTHTILVKQTEDSAPAQVSLRYGQELEKVLDAPTREGYKFMGWSMKYSASDNSLIAVALWE